MTVEIAERCGSTDADAERWASPPHRAIHGALDYMRVRGFPFSDDVAAFLERHEVNFIVEQNRDGQLRTLLVAEGMLPHDKLTPVLHYDGTPITARFITKEIGEIVSALNVRPIKKDKAA